MNENFGLHRFSVIIPCYNEAPSLPTLIAEAARVADIADGEFILVDNGSSDSTAQIFSSITDPRIRCVTTPKNLGYGGGILYGLKFASSEYVGWTHSDLQTPLADVIGAVAGLESGFWLVKGDRHGRKMSDRFFTAGMSLFESLLFGFKLRDINAQPTIFRRGIMEKWVSPPSDFSLDLYALVMASRIGAPIGRVDVTFMAREFGTSSWNSGLHSRIRFISRTLRFSFKLRSRLKIANHPAQD